MGKDSSQFLTSLYLGSLSILSFSSCNAESITVFGTPINSPIKYKGVLFDLHSNRSGRIRNPSSGIPGPPFHDDVRALQAFFPFLPARFRVLPFPSSSHAYRNGRKYHHRTPCTSHQNAGFCLCLRFFSYSSLSSFILIGPCSCCICWIRKVRNQNSLAA